MAVMIEWLRPAGVGVVIFFASLSTHNAVLRFHVLGTFSVVLMSATTAFESIIIGAEASENIGYAP